MTLRPIDAEALKQRLDAGTVLLVDVREDAEHRSEHIPGSQLMPLSRFEPALVGGDGKAVVFYCKGGTRTTANADLLGRGRREAYALTGGIMGWKAAGLPTEAGQGGGAGGWRRFFGRRS